VKKRYLLLLLLLLFLIFWFWPRPQVVHKVGGSTLSANKTQPPAKIVDNRAAIVDRLLKQNRLALGACMQSGREKTPAAVSLFLKWDAVSKLTAVKLSPSLGAGAEACIRELVGTWAIPLEPKLAPLSVSKKLSLSAR
jgi:hypothetical protein